MNTKTKYVLLIIFIIIISVFTIYALSAKKIQYTTNNLQASAGIGDIKIPEEESTTKLVFVGDIMLDRSVRASVIKNFGGDYSKLFENVKELQNADILFANLEGDVSDVGHNVGSKYSFRMDPLVLPILKDAGFDILSFANNHVGDWSIVAFKDTLRRLEEVGIEYTGASSIDKLDAEQPKIIEKNGVKFGFLGFTDVGPAWLAAKDNTPGILLASDPRLPEIIQNAKTQVDVLIVSFHWGVEYKKTHNSRQETLAHQAIDNGADAIIGHHPHVIQDTEFYKGKPIAYSLGNFIFDQYFSSDTMRSMVFEIDLKGKDIINTNTKYTTQNKQYQVEAIYSRESLRDKDDMTSKVCPKPTREYQDYTYLPIGQEKPLPILSYIPNNLTEVGIDYAIRSGICLKKEARDAFEEMAIKAKAEGLNIKITSGYRDYRTQQTLYLNNLKINKSKTSNSVAKSGYSEHQLGVALDLSGSSILYKSATNTFKNTKEEKWVEENAYKYGFIRSYGEGKESITGYMYEPWHYRYVGIDKAKNIKESGQTINEYLENTQN